MIFGIFVATKEQNIDMENKLNEQAISDYIDQFSTISLDQAYAGKETLSGEDIMKLPLKQIGLFSLRAIFQSWHHESQKFQSPFFDYESDAVKRSMEKLMNSLSNHISIRKSDFEPMFKQATNETIYLLFSPFKFYKELANEMSESGNLLVDLKLSKKFIKSNTQVLENMIQKLEENNEISSEDLVNAVFQDIDGGPDNIEVSLETFSSVLALDTGMLYEYTKEETTENVALNEDIEPDEIEEDNLVNNSYFVAGEIETVNERFTVEQKVTLADTLGKDKKDSIKTMLTINQKFMFINDLFEGNQNDFVKVIDFLEDCETENEAVAFIQNNYIKRNLWRVEAPAVKEFTRLIVSKFD